MIKRKSILAMLYLRCEATLECELRLQIIKLPATTFVNALARSIENRKVRVASRDLSPKAEKHPRMQNNRRRQKREKNGSERQAAGRARSQGHRRSIARQLKPGRPHTWKQGTSKRCDCYGLNGERERKRIPVTT